MLYLCGYSGYEKYAVADSDDNTVEVLTIEKLKEAASVPGVEISGVVAATLRGKTELTSIRPVQLPATETMLQRKTQMLKNIEVVVYHDIVTYIKFNYRDMIQPVELRLSDFGSRLGDCIIRGNLCPRKHIVTIILDKKATFTERTFKQYRQFNYIMTLGVEGMGIVFDVRELDDKEAIMIYKLLFDGNPMEMWDSIIDEPKRKEELYRVVSRGDIDDAFC